MSFSFVTKPTEEEKKIRKLKYNIFVNGKVKDENQSGIINQDLGSDNNIGLRETESLQVPGPRPGLPGRDYPNSKGAWAVLVVDINENKTIIDAKEENTNSLRIELIGIIESLKWVSNHTEQKYKKFVQITLNTSSIYCYNILNEWLDLWIKDETISTRPNSDLLIQLNKYRKTMNITSKLTYKVSNENAWAVDRKTNEKLNLHI